MKLSDAHPGLRRICDEDLPQLLRLNNEAVPAVNYLDETAFRALLKEAELAIVSATGGSVSAFLLAFGPRAAYQSPNYRWFASRFRDFLYIDRIVVDSLERGNGLGQRLYEAAFELAADRPLCCEVNLRPPNEGSLRFHRRLGFQCVGEADSSDGKRVAMLGTQPLAATG